MIAEMFWKEHVAVFKEGAPRGCKSWPKALQCWFGFVQETGWDGAGAGGCADLNLGRLQLKVDGAGGARCQADGCWDVLGCGPDVPVVQVCPECCAAVKHTVGFREDQS